MKKQLVAVLIILVFAGAAALKASQGTQPTKQPQVKTQQESDAFTKFQAESDPAKKALSGEQFIKDFPNSELLGPYVYPLLVQAYLKLNNPQKTVEYSEKALSSNPSKQTTLFLYQALVSGYQQLNNYEKTVESAERFLTVDPNNAFALVTLATVIPERIKDDDLDRDKKLTRTTECANKLLEIVNSMQKPATLTDEQWKMYKGQLQSGAYSSLGLVALRKKNYEDAVAQYRKSLELFPKDAYAYYRLGNAYDFLKKSDEAIRAYASSVALNGPPEARTELERVYKDKNKGSLEGMDKVISEAAASLK